MTFQPPTNPLPTAFQPQFQRPSNPLPTEVVMLPTAFQLVFLPTPPDPPSARARARGQLGRPSRRTADGAAAVAGGLDLGEGVGVAPLGVSSRDFRRPIPRKLFFGRPGQCSPFGHVRRAFWQSLIDAFRRPEPGNRQRDTFRDAGRSREPRLIDAPASNPSVRAQVSA